MDKQKELLTHFYQNISYGIFEVLIHIDQEIIDNVNSVIKAIFDLFFNEAYREKYDFFQKNIIQGLRYNIVLLSKESLDSNLIKAVYYKHREFIDSLKIPEVSLDPKMLEKIEGINEKFNNLYSHRRNKNEALVTELKNLLKKNKSYSEKLSN